MRKATQGREVAHAHNGTAARTAPASTALRSEADKLKGGGFDSQKSYFLNWIILVEGCTIWLTRSFGGACCYLFSAKQCLDVTAIGAGAWLCKAVFPTKLGLSSSQGTAMATALYKQVSACAIFYYARVCAIFCSIAVHCTAGLAPPLSKS